MPKTKEKLPAFQFYPGDWRKDPDLSRCTLAAKGVWIEVLCLMFECDQRGILATNGSPWREEEVVRAVGGDHSETLAALRELVRNSVLKVNKNGAFYSSKMLRDEELRQKRKACGKLGGNPRLVNQKRTQPPLDNQTPNPVGTLPLIPAGNQKPTPSSSLSSSPSDGGVGSSSSPPGSSQTTATTTLPLAQLMHQALEDEHFLAPIIAKGIPPADVAGWLQAFHRFLEYGGQPHKTTRDYRSHFANWINKLPYHTTRPADYSPTGTPALTTPKNTPDEDPGTTWQKALQESATTRRKTPRYTQPPGAAAPAPCRG